MLLPLPIQAEICGFDGIKSKRLHLRQDRTKEDILIISRFALIQVLLKGFIADLIPFLVLPILLTVLLHCVVGQMREEVGIASQRKS